MKTHSASTESMTCVDSSDSMEIVTSSSAVTVQLPTVACAFELTLLMVLRQSATCVAVTSVPSEK